MISPILTPLVQLTNILPEADFNIFAKLEMLSVGGSMKDRSSFNMIESGIKNGTITSDSIIVESSSGNMGIGLARACLLHDLQFICIVDKNITETNLKLLRLYGAKVEFAQPDAHQTPLEARLVRVNQIISDEPKALWINQYKNLHNPSGYESMLEEIASQLGKNIDYLICATGTVGTLKGCRDYVEKNKLGTKIIAVDAVGSVIFGGQEKPRLIPGHGASVRPSLYQEGLADALYYTSDSDCVKGCTALLEREGLLVGGSSGAIITALSAAQSDFKPKSNVVLILADGGDRYLDTIYNEDWVKEHIL